MEKLTITNNERLCLNEKDNPTASNSGGLDVTQEMWDIINQPGYLSLAKGGKRLRKLYIQKSLGLDGSKLSGFSLYCFIGHFDQVRQEVESGTAPDLEGTETPFKFGYATLIVAGAQRVSSENPTVKLRHLDTLNYLLSCGLPPDIGDIVGITALGHAVTSRIPKLDLARALIKAGANVNHQNRYGEVAIFGSFQHNHIAEIDLLLEHGADLEIKEADGTTPMSFFLTCGPQVTATVRKWINKRKGLEAPRVEKRCDNCGTDEMALKNCSKCQVARYCSVECQRIAWPTHKQTCQPFSTTNTVTLKPFYENVGSVAPTFNLTRQFFGIPANPTPSSHYRAAHIPKGLSFESKKLIIKVQVPFNAATGKPGGNHGNLFVYSKKRDFVCGIRRADSPKAYDRLTRVIKTQGVGGAKAYFAADLKSKDELIVKVSEVLAEQPF
ncbi:hypothetical protein BDZ94DRAFT_1271024 [Collybia nuda]|uniref:MYND-type domain-containing protein n=1 Tax=Collybia nuda TaxID=64659 RepID=A0A9P6CER8_9AGAR|nr:hypothetical protein BDZ94DRAFT_1271024 [Collybia nuda]